MSKRRYGTKMYELLMRLSPDVPIPTDDLCDVLYFDDPRTVGQSRLGVKKRFHGVLTYGREIGWKIPLVGGWKFGGLILGRDHYELIREAFGYCRPLRGPRVDWKDCPMLTPEGVETALGLALLECGLREEQNLALEQIMNGSDNKKAKR